ncbi:MAG TPA: hypothetical protein VMG36_02600 [Thermoplasmata archaeon]|nr:hypothetical protein [Thermoplasmata archaeon]
MAPGVPRAVPHRGAVGGRFSVSSLTLTVPEPAASEPGVARLAVPLLRRARERGVTGFDLSRSANPRAAAHRLRDAFPGADPELVVFVAAQDRSTGSRAARTGPLESLAALRRELGPHQRTVVLTGTETAPDDDRDLLRLRADGEILDLVRPLEPGSRGEDLRSGELSLLRPEAAQLLDSLPAATSPFLIAFDPFGAGALDGSWLERGALDRGPRTPPAALRELEGALAPVQRLGFLTRPGRPLMRAALDFVLGWPSVLTTVVPLPLPERLDAVLAAGNGAPFSDDELRQLGVRRASAARG